MVFVIWHEEWNRFQEDNILDCGDDGNAPHTNNCCRNLCSTPMDWKSSPSLSGARLICHWEAAPVGRSSVHVPSLGATKCESIDILRGFVERRWVVFMPHCSVSCFISCKYWAIELSSARGTTPKWMTWHKLIAN